MVIIIVMFVVGKALPERGAAVEGRLQAVPQTQRRIVMPLVAFAIVAVLMYVVSASYRLALINSMIGAVVCLSMVVITGYVAQISMLQMTLAGITGYSLARLTTGWGVPFPISPIIAIVVATVVGLLAALPALRVRGVNLAVITLAGGWAIEQFIFNNVKYTGDFDKAVVPPPTVFGTKLSFSSGRTIGQPIFGVFVLVVLTAVALVVSNLRRSPTGRRMLAVRTNERAAASMGVNVPMTKFIAFGVSAAIAGVAGCLISYQQTNLSPSSFSVLITVSILAIAFLGGITSVTGGLIGGALIAGGLMTEILHDLVFSKSSNGVALQALIGGIGLILTAILNPEGMSGAFRITGQQIKKKFRSMRPPSGETRAVPTGEAASAR